MTTNLLSRPAAELGQRTVLLIGNPNAGKTTLFNTLTGLRAKTANFPGVTVDLRQAKLGLEHESVQLIDLPGLYSLDALTPEEQVAEAALRGEKLNADAVLLVVDATNLQRNLFLASEVLELGRPTVIALTMIDAARSAGAQIDTGQLSADLGCPVVPVSGRTGEGITQLRHALSSLLLSQKLPVISTDKGSCTAGCSGCPYVARYDWATEVANRTTHTLPATGGRTEAIDRVITRPWLGIVLFVSIMLFVFYLIFSLADLPMTIIEDAFARGAQSVRRRIPDHAGGLLWSGGVFVLSLAFIASILVINNVRWSLARAALVFVGAVAICALPIDDFRSLIVDGVIGGVGGVLVFLPQICILFFFIAILEDSGYLARAAFVMERVMRVVGLPGKAFIPMLSAHACAIPGIMAARVIDNWRDRLVTILVLPLLTCSARLPVYAMIVALLFSSSPMKAAIVFTAAYLLGIAAALGTAFCLKKSILRGETVPLVMELPPYRRPSLKNALLAVYDRASIFVRQAGTIILLVSVVLWAMSTYPKMDETKMPAHASAQVGALRKQAGAVSGASRDELLSEAERIVQTEQLSHSLAGRIGRAAEPVFEPLGFTWEINVGIMSSFAAREVLVSTLAIVYGKGATEEEQVATLTQTLRSQQKEDGTPVFSPATSLSLLVFFVLAMQCLPTQVVTRRETGSWKWALLQFGYMTLLAYTAALVVYQGLIAFGIA